MLIVHFYSSSQNILNKFTRSSKIGPFLENFIVLCLFVSLFFQCSNAIAKMFIFCWLEFFLISEYFKGFFEISLGNSWCNWYIHFLAINVAGEDQVNWAVKKSRNNLSLVFVDYVVWLFIFTAVNRTIEKWCHIKKK